MRCAACPVAADRECLGETHPVAFAHFCRWATSDEPREREMVALRSAVGYTPPPAVTGDVPPPTPGPAPMLAGDLVAAATARLGADRLAKWIEAKTGQPCGCEARRQAMNRLDASLRRWLARG